MVKRPNSRARALGSKSSSNIYTVTSGKLLDLSGQPFPQFYSGDYSPYLLRLLSELNMLIYVMHLNSTRNSVYGSY